MGMFRLRGKITFGEFVFDFDGLRLFRHGALQALQPSPAAMLRALLARPGEVITRQELSAAMWPGGEMLDHGHAIEKCAHKLRSVLGDTGPQRRYVQTVARRGYCFTAPAYHAPAAPAAARAWTRLAVMAPPAAEAAAEMVADELGMRLPTVAVMAPEVARAEGGKAWAESRARRADYVLTGRWRTEGTDADPGAAGWDAAPAGMRLFAARDGALLWEQESRGGADWMAAMGRAMEAPVRPPLRARAGVSAAARSAYLRARVLLRRRNGPDMRRALEEFERAIAADAQCAPAYAGAATCQWILAYWGLAPARAAMRKARQAAQQALELAPRLAEPYLALAQADILLAGQWPGAKRYFRAALARNPSYALALHHYGRWQVARGEAKRGLAANARALVLDRRSAPFAGGRIYLLMCAGRIGEALALGRRATAACPHRLAPRLHFGTLCGYLGRAEDAVAQHERAVEIAHGMAYAKAALAESYALSGRRRQARALLAELEAVPADTYANGAAVALAHAVLGQREQALAALDRAIAARDPAAAFLAVDPRFRLLSAAPGWAPLVERVKQWINFAGGTAQPPDHEL